MAYKGWKAEPVSRIALGEHRQEYDGFRGRELAHQPGRPSFPIITIGNRPVFGSFE